MKHAKLSFVVPKVAGFLGYYNAGPRAWGHRADGSLSKGALHIP